MLLAAAALLLVLLQVPDPGAAQQRAPAPDSAGTAYADAEARALVRGARDHIDRVDRSIEAYRVTARERIFAGVRALRRDRTLYQRELAARILWRRDGIGRVELLGARQVAPMFTGETKVPDDAGEEAANLAFDPGKQLLLQGLGGSDDDDLRHPLAPGSERDYRFATGDTTRVRLANGTELRLVELRVVPRRPDGRLVRGSFWLEAERLAPVRAAFQLARPLDIVRDLEEPGAPGWVPSVTMDLRYLTIDYGLWEGRWWLPRLISLEGEMEVAGVAALPVRFERAYSGYEVEGAGGAPLALSAADLRATADTLPGDTTLRGPVRGDTLTRGEITLGSDGVTMRVERRCDDEDDTCFRYRVEQPADSALLGSAELGESAFARGEELITEGELRALADALRVPLPEVWQRPELRWTYLQPTSQLRYNRVEGLALGARLDADFGAARARATLWVPTAQLEPVGEVALQRDRFASRYQLTAYRRLLAVQPDPRALSLGSSLSALLFGRDEAFYYRSWGAELTREPLGVAAWEYRWRLFAERQGAARRGTDVALPSLWEDGPVFRGNPAAEPADLAGATLALRAERGLDPEGWRWTGELSATAAAGTHAYLQPSLVTSVGIPLPGRMGGALEVAGGTTLGDLPLQESWFLGGPSSVRGYGEDRLAGEAFWRARAELGRGFPAFRLALFSDAGWAGAADDLSLDPPLLSAGAGVSVLDGLVRLDLSRRLRALPGGSLGWRLDLYLDAIF